MNLTRLLKHNLFIFLTIFFLFSSISVLFAQIALSIGVSPTSEMLKLEPGETHSGELVFWNLSDTKGTYNVYISGFKQIQNQPGTAVILTPEEDSKALYSASKWVTVSEEVLVLEPNRNSKLQYTITVPNDVTDGEYNAEIFLISKNDSTKDGNVTFTNLASGVPILIEIGDEFVENAELLRFVSDKKTYEKPYVKFLTTIKNLGDTHVSPKGEIVVTNIFKQEVARIPFNRSTQSLLRDNTGNYEDSWIQSGYLSPNNAIAVGPMKATLLVTYRSFQPGFAVLNAQTTFWIIPWKIILAILAIILLAIIFKVSKKKIEKKYERP